MKRRNLIETCLWSMTAAAASPSLSILNWYVPSEKQTPGDLSFPNDVLSYLKTSPDFSQMEKILNSYGTSKLITKESAAVSSNQIHLFTMNSSYGRWSNFSFSSLTTQVIQDKNELNKLFILTQGPAGKLLSQRTSLNVIGQLSHSIKSQHLIYDALPHFYNASFFNEKKPSDATYFIDSTSRKTLHIGVEFLGSKNINTRDLVELNRLKDRLQNSMDEYQSRALKTILSHYDVRDFSAILNLVQIRLG